MIITLGVAVVYLVTPSTLANAVQKPLLAINTATTPTARHDYAHTQVDRRKLHGRFLHITDIHPDPFYKFYSSTEEEVACHRGSGPAGYYGAETSDCDSPLSLVNATFKWIEQNLKDNIDFVIWTGDSARHDNDEHIPRSNDQVIGQNQLLVDKFRDVFGNKNAGRGFDIPIVPSFGNNDILPHNIFLKGPNRWTKTYADIWRPFIPEEQRHGFDRGGWFYVEVIPNKLAVFSLNTMYFFDSNNAVDGCADHKQPGHEHLEWLRIQLQFLRERGVKAIISGHVPPARNDEKVGWDETCWQKYALWMQKYRDVVVGSVYGHMNIEHFILQDFKDIDFAVAAGEVEPEERYAHRETTDNDDVSVKLKTPDYLMALREIWSKLPTIPDSLSVLKKEGTSQGAQKTRRRKHKPTDEQKFYSKIGGAFAERFAVSHIAASVVPNFFSTMRVFEYNITGLEDASVSAEAFSLPVPAWQERGDHADASVPGTISSNWISIWNFLMELVPPPLRSPFLDATQTTSAFNDRDPIRDQKHNKHKSHKSHKKKKPKFIVPDPPSSTSPPGPAYSPQSLSWLGYKQYVANTTYLNNDFHGSNTKPGPDIDIASWNPGRNVDKHPGREKKNGKPSPRSLTFVLEYDTRGEKDNYRLGEGLTVRKWVELAASIGEFRGEEGSSFEMKCEGEDKRSHEVDGAAVDDMTSNVMTSRLCEREDSECDGGDMEVEKHTKHRRKKHKNEKKKKKHDREQKKRKKRRKIVNRDWFAFVSRAVTATMDDEELHEKFGEVDVDLHIDDYKACGVLPRGEAPSTASAPRDCSRAWDWDACLLDSSSRRNGECLEERDLDLWTQETQ